MLTNTKASPNDGILAKHANLIHKIAPAST